MKKIFWLGMILLLGTFLLSYIDRWEEARNEQEPTQTVYGLEATIEHLVTFTDNAKTNAMIYHNTQYGFDFSLPASWKGYQIITDKWEGLSLEDSQGEEPTETGPLISIRHPLWTSSNPRQDIPIMVFTIAQWDALQQDKFHIGAAPIGPSELGRNSRYVFALPARYNFAFPTGYEEVETILNSKPLKPIEIYDALVQ